MTSILDWKNLVRHKRIIIIIISTSIIIGVQFFAISFIQNQTEQKIQDSLISSSIDKQHETVKRISAHISSDLELISDKIEFSSIMLNDKNFKSKFVLDSLEKLHSNLNSKTAVRWVFILDENGIITSSVNSTGIASVSTSKIDLSFRDYFIHPKSELTPYFTNGFMGINDMPLVILSSPILDNEGKFHGLIVASLDVNKFFKQYGNMDDPNSDLLMIIGNDKNFIIHPDPIFFGKNVFDEDHVSQLDSKGVNIFETLFVENVSFGEYVDNSQQKIANAQTIMLDGKVQYYVIMTTLVETIYQQTNTILEQEKFLVSMIIFSLIIAAGIMIFVFEKYKIREEAQKDAKLITIGELSSRLAHDLRNPLSVIRISLDNLKTLYGTDDVKQKQFDKADRSIDRIVHQIDDVLDFVKEKLPKKNMSSISEIISETLDSLVIPDTIELILPKNDVELFCDKRQLSIAINNLILNSIQAIEGKGTIEIRVKENKSCVIFEIKDSGIGISKKNMPDIFEPLFTTKQEGTGLGLASVKSIIESHDGIISASSTPTIFTMKFPKSSNLK